MITTELYDGQGLGNQLWVYAACRSIAEHLGLPFAILGGHRFKGGGFLNIDFGEPHDAGSTVMAREYPDSRTVFWERMFYDPDLDYVASGFDEGVASLGPRTRLEGLFQSERYFFGDKTRIHTYTTLAPQRAAAQNVGDDTCILNIRGGEYKAHKRLILPTSYWRGAMANMRSLAGIKSFLIVTDDPRYARAMFPEIDVVDGGIEACYRALHGAKHVIVSNSSFSCFPLMCGRTDRVVIAPRYWARFGNRHQRWASPANLYAGWLWQNEHGSLASSVDCQQEQLDTEHYYLSRFNVSQL